MERHRVLVWVGRLLLVAGVVYGMYSDPTCGPAFFSHSSADELTQAVCAGPLADRRGEAIFLLFVGFACMGAGQVLGIRASKDSAAKD